jgi:acyl-CoA thioesterase-2
VSQKDFEELLAILDLNRVDDDTFTGSHPSRNPVRTFGGQMMAQAFVAGSRTVSEKLRPSALSVHFIAGGDPEKDLEYHVLRLRDERRFANRRVDVMQNGELLTTAIISYMNGGSGIEHGIKPPELPDPESVPSIDDLLRGFEDVVPHFVKGERLDHNRVWMKAVGAMPDDPVINAAALVYSSDTTVLDSIITTHGLSWGFDRIFAVTMNHSVWFHRQVRFDEWVLYSTSSPVAADSRGLGTGHFFDRSGQLLATVVQEGIVKYFPGANTKRA